MAKAAITASAGEVFHRGHLAIDDGHGLWDAASGGLMVQRSPILGASRRRSSMMSSFI